MFDSKTLAGIRVLDLGSRASSAWCTRLLADFGAEVWFAETAAGHPLRAHGPFAGPAGASVAASYLLANKTSLALDPQNAEAVAPVAAAVNVVVTDALPGDPLDWLALESLNPRLLICAITPHGQTGERARLPGNDLTANALSGWASVNGLEGREPLKASGYQASYQAGTFAFGCVICALLEQLASGGPGQRIDVAEAEVLVSTFAPAPLRYQYSGFVWPRKQALDVNDGPVPVQDGYFALTISRPVFWIKAMRILGLPDLAEDPNLQQPGVRPKYKSRFADRLKAAMASWTRMALFEALGRERVIAGPVLTMDELADNPQFEAREFFRCSPEGVRYPGPFARMGASSWSLRHGLRSAGSGLPPPGMPDEIRVYPRRAAGPAVVAGSDAPEGAAAVADETGLRGPLAGFRGLVLTQAWAGTYATQLLALLGAEVIQLEVRGRLDSWRGSYSNPIPKCLQNVPSATNPWNCSPLYNSVNLNKQCITVDLTTPEGVQIFRDLVVHVDFVAENFSPRVMGKLGLGYDALCEIRPDLVMASLSAYGATGPWANVPGIGGTIEPSSGMSALLGYPGGPPLNSGQMYPDPVAGLCGFAAIALALLHRDRTGAGQHIDLSMQEANFTFIGDAWLEYELAGGVRGPQGNAHPVFAPHGIYPAAGEDQWIAISAETDRQWRELAEILALDLPGGESMFATAEQRKEAEATLNHLLAATTRSHDKHALAARLAGAGIPAAAVHNAAEVADDQALRERGHMVAVTHPEAGTMWQSGLAAQFSRTPGGVHGPAPLQGQHSQAVMQRFLGLSASAYQVLAARGVTGKGPTDRSTVENQA